MFTQCSATPVKDYNLHPPPPCPSVQNQGSGPGSKEGRDEDIILL